MLHEGRVVRVDAKSAQVEVDGRVVVCVARGAMHERHRDERRPLAVGDVVRVDLGETPGSVEERLPRRTVLFRASPGEDRRPQVIVANADQVLVVGSVRDPAFAPAAVDRVLAAAEHGGLASRICLNKIDLAAGAEVERIRGAYRGANVPVFPACALRGEGLEPIRDAMSGRVTVLAGLSGVGKTTLLNALQPGLGLRVREVSQRTGEGRHTTTAAAFHRLDSGTAVVDTPGVRSFALWQVESGDVRLLFPELAAIEGRCRVASCAHRDEPGCLARGEVEAGRIAPSRLASYHEVFRECDEERRAASGESRREGRTRVSRSARAPIEDRDRVRHLDPEDSDEA